MGDLPQEYRRWFDDRRRRREVKVSIMRFDLIGAQHYHVTVEEEDDYAWDPKEKIWVCPWESLHNPMKGDHDTYRANTHEGAVRFADAVIRDRYGDGRHKIVWERTESKKIHGVLYAREGD